MSMVAILLYSGGSTPSDKWGGGAPSHPDPEIKGGGGPVSKNFFSALRARPQFGLKISGGPGPPRLLPLIRLGPLTIALLQFPKMSFA